MLPSTYTRHVVHTGSKTMQTKILTTPFSITRLTMAMPLDFCSQTICQKCSAVWGRGPWKKTSAAQTYRTTRSWRQQKQLSLTTGQHTCIGANVENNGNSAQRSNNELLVQEQILRGTIELPPGLLMWAAAHYNVLWGVQAEFPKKKKKQPQDYSTNIQVNKGSHTIAHVVIKLHVVAEDKRTHLS